MLMRFIGKDNSMGFKTNEIYDVIIKKTSKWIELKSGKLYCPYSNEKSLYSNWMKLK